ncbi:MAG: LptF/LptG family permease [Muribaculaceae bacterium]|nr:LptF/LptG family permease [Muribaculaceae bacterium]
MSDKKKSKSGRKKFHFGWNSIGLKLLDIFILKKYLGTFFFATLLILAVVTMFDITEKLDAFLTAPLKETLFDYFVSFLPYFANQLAPLFTFIAVIFFTTKLAGNSEIIAILSSGISFNRFMRPYMIGAAVIAAMIFALSNYVIPPTNIKRIAYTNKYVKNVQVTSGVDIQLMARPGEVVYIGRFENSSKTGYRFSFDKFKNKELVSRLTSQTITYDSARMYHWTAHNYMIRDFDGMKEKIRTGDKLDTIIPIEPRDFLISEDDQETMTTPQLSEYIDNQKSRGVANIKAFEIEKERRYASTAAAFILTLIGVSLSAKKVKGGMGINIGIGLVLSFSYILFSAVTSQFAISGMTSPWVAMWIPNFLYLGIGLFLYYRARKF